MAHTRGMEDAADGADGKSSSGAAGLRSRPGSSERDARVRAAKAALQCRLGPYEPLLTYLQSVLAWERPVQCLLLYVLLNVVFWFFALTSLRLLFLLASGLASVVCVDTWRNKIWPKLRVRNQDESESESWGLVQPGILSVPELCHHVAEAWVSAVVLASNVMQFKRLNPGRFCILTCCLFFSLAVIGRYVPGLVLSYSTLLATLLAPLAAYNRVFQCVFAKLEPVLQRLDFSVCGYMMSKPLDNQFLRLPLHGVISGEGSDSEEELAAFCPTFDDIVVAKELALTDSEHSDAEISYTDNGTFNLSRGQTPLTEGSEDLDKHSDAEESFAQDLPDFPSINPDATLMDDDDDTSIGLPSLALSGLQSHRASALDVDAHLDSDQEDLDAEMSLSGLPPVSDFMGDLAGDIASNMIRAALVGAMQPRRPSAQRRRPPAKVGPHRSYRKQSSSELDTDFDVEDFEMLDQSELSQMESVEEGQHRESQGSNFLSSLLGAAVILAYLNAKNRPYSTQDVFCNLQKQHGLGKTAVVKSMELLALEGKIKEKTYGKQKIYFADQAQFKDVNDADLKGMDSQISNLNEEMQALIQSCRQLDAELKDLNNSLTTQEMTSQITRLRDECSVCRERLDKIKSVANHVTPEEKDKVLKEHNIYVKEWRKRKRLASDMMDTILEGYPKSKKEFLEEVGVETDEDYKVVVPTV